MRAFGGFKALVRTMKPTLTFLAVLLLVQLVALHAAQESEPLLETITVSPVNVVLS